MIVAMTWAALLAFGQIVLALLLLYACGIVLHALRQPQATQQTPRPNETSIRRHMP